MAQSDAVFSSARTGAATAVARETLAALPTMSGPPQRHHAHDAAVRRRRHRSAGQDNRLNNITVDGSYFNNSFGLGGAPGDRTGVAPISLEAIEQVQVNVAPFDVRQGNFVGAGVNTVTRSGGNTVPAGRCSTGCATRPSSAPKPKGLAFNPGTFDSTTAAGGSAGPIVKNKLFFFESFENAGRHAAAERPSGRTAAARRSAGNMTRVLASDLQTLLSAFLKSKFNYDTGPYRGHPFETPGEAVPGQGRLQPQRTEQDHVRYNQLDSNTDVLCRTRRRSASAADAQHQLPELRELELPDSREHQVGHRRVELVFGGNNGEQPDRRLHEAGREPRPTSDALPVRRHPRRRGSAYTSIGYEPFTPNNELRYNTFQVQDSFTKFGKKHSLTFGGALEKYHSENVFFPGKQSAYVYNSLADFYTDANDYLANPNRTMSPVTLRHVPGALT